MEFRTDFPTDKVGHEIGMAGIIMEGEGQAWVIPFPECLEALNELEDINWPDEFTREDWDALVKQMDMVETEMTTKNESGELVKIMLRKCQRNIEAQVSWAVFRRDGYRCRYCGRDDVPLTVDHLVLWEQSGPSIEANLVSACKKCNKKRGRMEYADWLRSDRYQEVSARLSPAVRQANLDLVGKLDAIPRLQHQRSR